MVFFVIHKNTSFLEYSLICIIQIERTKEHIPRVFEYSFDDCNASLVPEPTNEHDPNAVRVEVKGILIGRSTPRHPFSFQKRQQETERIQNTEIRRTVTA